MNNLHKRRMYILLGILLALALIVALVLYALRQNINLFFTPNELLHTQISTQAKIRVGGMVMQDSIVYEKNLKVSFGLTDYQTNLTVIYQGLLPDLFREGQGVVVFGTLRADGVFRAEQILAKHDQNYMPPALADKIIEVQDVT